MDYIIVAIIIYFILQVTANLVRIWRGRGGLLPQGGLFGEREDEHKRLRDESPRFWGEDIEDAKWEDVSDDNNEPR